MQNGKKYRGRVEMSEELDHLKINEKKNRKKNEEKNYIKRIKNGNTFRYTYKDNRPVNDKNTLEKISKIYIAPAYRNVKIFLDNDLLAVGIDDKGRNIPYIFNNIDKKWLRINNLHIHSKQLSDCFSKPI
jgi:DNA topoisomerase IB